MSKRVHVCVCDILKIRYGNIYNNIMYRVHHYRFNLNMKRDTGNLIINGHGTEKMLHNSIFLLFFFFHH